MADETVLHEEPKSMEIPLTRGYVAIVDAEDYKRLAVYNWYASCVPGSKTPYAMSQDGDVRLRMHRFILGLSPDDPEVDHVNENGIDNRKKNLRLVSRRQNALNQSLRRTNTSGFRGVSWSKTNNCWWARIKVSGKTIHLGLFDVLEDGARAYDVAALKYNGEFARLNFPPEKVGA